MKIGILLENPIQVGGGFNQAINAIVQLQRIIGKQHEVVAFTTIKANLQHLKRLEVPAEYLPAAGRLSRIALAVLRRLSRKEIGKQNRKCAAESRHGSGVFRYPFLNSELFPQAQLHHDRP
jgi:hypothetical protein